MEYTIPCGLSITLYLIILIFSVVSLILFFISIDYSNKLPFEFINDLKANWNLNYMTDIISTDSYTCPNGYEPFFTNDWPGTKEGCVCNMVVNIGNCKELGKDTDKLCKDIKGIEKVSYRTWNNKRVCVQRGDKTYFDLNIYKDTCPSNFPKKCGVIDSQNNILCVLLTENCPINEIQILDKFATLSTSKFYHSSLLADKKIVFTDQSTDMLIPIITKVSDETPCINPKYENYYKGQSYVLDNYFTYETCSVPIGGSKREDSNYIKLDTYSSDNILRENGIYNVYNKISELPLFPKDRLNHTSSLFTRSYYGIDTTCKSSLINNVGNITEFTQYLDSLSIHSQSYPKYLYQVRIPVIIQLVIISIWFLVNLYKLGSYTDYSSPVAFFIVIMAIASLVISIIALGFVCNVIIDFNNLDIVQLSFLTGCLDETSEILLNSFIESSEQMKTYGIASTILIGLNIGLLFTELLIWRCCEIDPESIDKGKPIASEENKKSEAAENINIVEFRPTKVKSVKKSVKDTDLKQEDKNKIVAESSGEKEKENEVTKTPQRQEQDEGMTGIEVNVLHRKDIKKEEKKQFNSNGTKVTADNVKNISNHNNNYNNNNNSNNNSNNNKIKYNSKEDNSSRINDKQSGQVSLAFNSDRQDSISKQESKHEIKYDVKHENNNDNKHYEKHHDNNNRHDHNDVADHDVKFKKVNMEIKEDPFGIEINDNENRAFNVKSKNSAQFSMPSNRDSANMDDISHNPNESNLS